MENKPLYFSNGDNVMIVVFNENCENDLRELHGLTVESDNEFFFYLMGTDAWGELEEKSGKKYLVFKSTQKIYFRCPVSDDILKKLKREHGFMLIESVIPITVDELQEKFGESCELQEIDNWMREKEEENGLEIGEINGMICCFFTENEKEKFGIK